MTYPTCTHAGSACSGDPRQRTVSFQYQLGRLTAVPGWAGSISYHSNGMLNEVGHANGVTYAQGLDPHRMRRPGSLSVTHPLHALGLAENEGVLLVSLPYAYDGAGNVKSWYDWRYRYDRVSRVLEGAIVGGWGQSYGYDLYGNLLSITTRRGAGPQTVALGVDRTTNRLSASAYDAAGNLTFRSPFSYTWDSLSMMKTMTGRQGAAHLHHQLGPRRPGLEPGLRPSQRPAPRHRPSQRRRRDPTPLPPRPPRHAATDHQPAGRHRGVALVLPLWRGAAPGRGYGEDEVYRAREGPGQAGAGG